MFLITCNIINSDGIHAFLPIQANIYQGKTQFVVSCHIIPDVMTEYKKNPQEPTGDVT